MPALEDLKEQDNSYLSMDDCMLITKLHLNAIKQLIVDEFDNDTVKRIVNLDYRYSQSVGISLSREFPHSINKDLERN